MEDYGWLGPTLERLAGLLAMPDLRNSYHCKKIRPGAAYAVMEALMKHMRPRTPAPRIMPTELGGLSLDWHAEGVDFGWTIENGLPGPGGAYIPGAEAEAAFEKAMVKLCPDPA